MRNRNEKVWRVCLTTFAPLLSSPLLSSLVLWFSPLLLRVSIYLDPSIRSSIYFKLDVLLKALRNNEIRSG